MPLSGITKKAKQTKQSHKIGSTKIKLRNKLRPKSFGIQDPGVGFGFFMVPVRFVSVVGAGSGPETRRQK
jgi:hypothetical protein